MRYFSDDKTRNVKVFEKNYFNLSFQAQSGRRDDKQESRKVARMSLTLKWYQDQHEEKIRWWKMFNPIYACNGIKTPSGPAI